MSEPVQSSYDSIAQAAAGLGCTVARLRKAKKAGAPGFRGSRVYPAELIPWLEASEETAELEGNDQEALLCKKLRLQCERLQFDMDRDAGKMWDSDQVKASWLSHMRSARQAWLAIAAGLAPQLAGHPVVEIERKIIAAIDAGLEKLRGNPHGHQAFGCPHCGRAIASEDFRGNKNDERTGEVTDKQPGEIPGVRRHVSKNGQRKSGARGKPRGAARKKEGGAPGKA